MDSKERISALLITKNEGENLPPLLKNIEFADEIIVVDSFSSDQTVEVIKQFPKVKFYQKEFKNFSDQRNFALGKANNNWVLFIDADERISEKLKFEILTTDLSKTEFVAFKMKRQMYFDEQKIRFSGFQTDKVYRLFNKNFVYFDKKTLVHEKLIVSGKYAVLKEKLDHYSYRDKDSYQNKLDQYAQLRAKELLAKNLHPNIFHFYLKPLYRFLNHYFIRLGFLDGTMGLTLARLHAQSVKKRYVYLKQLMK
ncbi:glycosyltransferase family 2 protein [Namhaeicola litoreus]|uniref:Glycosyltransferase family 2 protein n=1 Tax=Namhaeicola litoreus TaxID=1052145 RepID=A0ABW3Y1J3_9FLAO